MNMQGMAPISTQKVKPEFEKNSQNPEKKLFLLDFTLHLQN